MFLFVGLGLAAVGLVITFVGLGEKGFRTLELKLVGPCLVGGGLLLTLLRILLCTVAPSWTRNYKHCTDREKHPEQGDKKGVENIQGEENGMERVCHLCDEDNCIKI